jgi:chemotaxis protein methyltransferase CheR
MTALDVLPKSGWDFKLLATDLDSNVLEKASQGIYSIEQIQGLPSNYAKRWFTRLPEKQAKESGKARDELKEYIHFKRLNLLANWPMQGPFDIIFCRNVLIYFDQKTKDNLIDRYAKLLRSGGYLFIGHSESMKRDNNTFESLGHTIYRKK